jgi:hypothetical protein
MAVCIHGALLEKESLWAPQLEVEVAVEEDICIRRGCTTWSPAVRIRQICYSTTTWPCARPPLQGRHDGNNRLPPSADTYHRSPGGRRMRRRGPGYRASTTGSTVAAGSHSLSPFVCMFVQRVAHELSPCERAERPVPVAMATPWSGDSTC